MDPEQTYNTMFHEANHYLTHLIAPNFAYPRWIDEGLGDYYGTSEWDPAKKKMAVGNIDIFGFS